MSKKKIDVYRTGIYLRLSQGDEDIDGWEKQESRLRQSGSSEMSFRTRKRAKIVVIDMEIHGRGWYNIGGGIDNEVYL